MNMESQLTPRRPELLQAWQPSVIKGNAAEIGALAESAEVSLDLPRSYMNLAF